MARMCSGGSGGGGGPGGPDPPLLGQDVGFLTLGPKLDPPVLLVDLRWTPVADPGCVCDRGACECPRVGVFFNFLRADDNVQGGGVLVKNPVSAPGPPPLQKSWIRA